MGLFGDIFSAGTNTIDAATGGWWSDQSTKSTAKRQYNYNYNLMKENQAFQKYMAENAHQLEMQDLEKAGLNPALTVTGSSAGSIAGSSSNQSTGNGIAVDTLQNIVNGINATRKTNAEVENLDEETDAIPQKLNNEATNAKANLISAEAQKTQAETQEKLAKGGIGSSIFGTENGGLGSSIAATVAPLALGGVAGAAVKGINLYKKAKMAKGFSKFIKSATSAK